ncbi:glycosyltransferase [archaeon]|nr:MAG: glycosyltransferase [archaeon]
MEKTASLSWGVLLPFTSKDCKSRDDALNCIEAFGTKCHITADCNISVFIGLDDDDKHFGVSNYPEDLAARLQATWFPGFTATRDRATLVHIFYYPTDKPARICDIWRSLAMEAVDQGCFYLVLLGDDVNISVAQVSPPAPHTHWVDSIENAFHDLHKKFPSLPFGFGCVALKDVNAPSFPTFPVLTKVHVRIFPDLFPKVFVNQDADPFVFEIYRRFGAAKIIREVEITNEKGGYEHGGNEPYTDSRYKRCNIDWRPLLPEAIVKIENWTKAQDDSRIFRVVVMDVIVPTYRVEKEYIRRIVSMTIPKQCDVRFLIIVDNPKVETTWLKDLCREMEFPIRYRLHKDNQGASAARNTGLDHSCADWIVFVDDDVLPKPCLLEKYAEAIKADGHTYDGFVGWTILGGEKRSVKTPYDTHHLEKYHHLGVKAAGIAYFWDAPAIMPELPWGITANLCVRYVPGLEFNKAFIRTGGGEDIDFCLRLPKQPLKSLPSAIAFHPWWNRGGKVYGHIFRWALGDSLLQVLYPQYSFYDWPNVIEVSLFALLWGVVMMMVGQQTMGLRLLVSIPFLLACDALWDFTIITSEPYRGAFLSKGTLWDRMAALVEANVHKNAVELGHLLGPLLRGQMHYAFCYRFNWFCKVMPNYPQKTRSEHLNRLACFVSIVALAVNAPVA